MTELAPGDEVVVTVGRHRESKAVLVEVASVPTPSGSEVSVARIRRPRAGETYVFTSDLRPSAQARPDAAPASEEFRP